MDTVTAQYLYEHIVLNTSNMSRKKAPPAHNYKQHDGLL